MTKSKKAVLIVLSLALIAGAAVFLICYNREEFKGYCIKNTDGYYLDIERMNGTDTHTLKLHKGDILQIQFETEKGTIQMEIKAPNGTAIYSGNGKGATDFTVNIAQSGVYTAVVDAHHAKGTINIQLKGE